MIASLFPEWRLVILYDWSSALACRDREHLKPQLFIGNILDIVDVDLRRVP